MNSIGEKRLLLTILNQLDAPSDLKRRNKFLGMIVGLFLWVLLFCGIEAFFHYGGAPQWTDGFLALTCLGIGYVFAYQKFNSMHRRQWPFIAPYLDRAEIERRLHELGA